MFSITVRSGISGSSWETTPTPAANDAPRSREPHPYPGGQRRARIARRERLVAQPDLAAVRTQHPRYDLDQRRLARPVLAEQRVHLAAPYVEAHLLQRVHPGERLGQPVRREQPLTVADLVELRHSRSPGRWAASRRGG